MESARADKQVKQVTALEDAVKSSAGTPRSSKTKSKTQTAPVSAVQPQTVAAPVVKTKDSSAKKPARAVQKVVEAAPALVVSAAPSMADEFDIPSRKNRKPVAKSRSSQPANVAALVSVEPLLEAATELVEKAVTEPVVPENAAPSRKNRGNRAQSAMVEAARVEPTLAALRTALEETESAALQPETPSSTDDFSQSLSEATAELVLDNAVPSRKNRNNRKKATPETPLLEAVTPPAEIAEIKERVEPEQPALETAPEALPTTKSSSRRGKGKTVRPEIMPAPTEAVVEAQALEPVEPVPVEEMIPSSTQAEPVVPSRRRNRGEAKPTPADVVPARAIQSRTPKPVVPEVKGRSSRRRPAKTPVEVPFLLEVDNAETPIEVTSVHTLENVVSSDVPTFEELSAPSETVHDAVREFYEGTPALDGEGSLESRPSQPSLESQPSSQSVPTSGERPSRRRRRGRGEPRPAQPSAEVQPAQAAFIQENAEPEFGPPDDDLEITSGNLDVYGIYGEDSSEAALETVAERNSSEMDSSGVDSTEIDSSEATQDRTGRTPDDAVLEFFRRHRKPWHVRDLERGLPRIDRTLIGGKRDLETLLERLTEAGTLIRTRKHTYGLVEVMNLVRGRFQGNSKGFGFVIPEDDSEDLYIDRESTLEAWNGDTVLARVEGRRGKEESPRGTIARIVKRGHDTLVGTLEFSKGYALLKPDDPKVPHRVLLLPDNLENVKGGARVLANLFWPEATGEDEVYGAIQDILGDSDNPETETKAVILKHDLRDEFPLSVEREAEKVALELSPANYAGRLDLRDRNIFTVDGRDAKDFDDAIHIEALEGGGFLVGVHIADVSFYVREGSELDKEAYARATSVYLPGKVLPMLPEKLSNGVCSLVPDQDRLTLSAMIQLSSDGEVQAYHLGPSVIHSKARLTYDEVQAYSEGAAPMPVQARALEGDLHLLLKLTTKMRTKRLREGSLDFKLREVKVEVDREGNLTLIPIREETARGMIEDLMLLANKVVAGYMLEKNVPALYRIHQDPSPSSFQEVSVKIARLGLAFPGNEPTPQNYQAVLKQARGTPQESFVNQALLRSLQQAKYSHENLGHFGLAFDEYLHFTSPIRRYPDLQVHRALRASLEGRMRGAVKEQLEAKLPEMGTHTSERERAATEAERDLTKYYQAKWAQAHLGEGFYGTVSGIIARGMFVSLQNGVEGLVHVSELGDDYFIYLEEAQMFRGRSSGRTFRFGDEVFIRIEQVNPLARQIDLALDAPENFDMAEDNNFRPRARRGARDERPARTAQTPTGQNNVGQNGSSARPSDGNRPGSKPAQGRTTPVSGGEFSRPNGDSGQGNAGQANSGQTRGGRPPFQPTPGQAASSEGRAREEGRTSSNQSSSQSGSHSSSQSGSKRRIVTLERTRPEYSRPVNVTVQRVYFGDWDGSNLKADEEGRGDYRRGGNSTPRADRSFQGRPPRGGVSTTPRTAGENSSPARAEGRPARSSGGNSQPRAAQARTAQARVPQVIVPQEQELGSSATSSSINGSSAEGAAEGDGAARRRRRRRRRPSGNAAGSSEG